jgi:hypothetical protein
MYSLYWKKEAEAENTILGEGWEDFASTWTAFEYTSV